MLQLPFELSAVVALAEAASKLALEWQGRCLAQVKADNTLVTEADRAVEAFLHEHLSALAPGFSFLGEESGLSGAADAPCWVIDPIDGTTNFVRGVPLWCVSIGLVHESQPILGVVSVPPQNEILYGARGAGAFIRGADGIERRLQARDPEMLIQEDLIACNTSVEEAVDFSGVPCRLRNFGSLAYHLTLLARGVVCGNIAHWHNLYDIAGGMSLCLEAGCAPKYLDGTEWEAQVVRGKMQAPLLIAAPNCLQVLGTHLSLREPPLNRGSHSLGATPQDSVGTHSAGED
jgi:fructose-1,6-bisphosphatase/inositol monophosphatase family enzyme